jgi:hypothetical protein
VILQSNGRWHVVGRGRSLGRTNLSAERIAQSAHRVIELNVDPRARSLTRSQLWYANPIVIALT